MMVVAIIGLGGEGEVGSDPVAKVLRGAGIFEGRYLSPIMMAWMFACPVGDVIGGLHGHVAGKFECGNKSPQTHSPACIHIRDIQDKQVSALNRDVEAFVLQAQEIGTTSD